MLSVTDLQKETKHRKQSYKVIYKQILNIIYQKIKQRNIYRYRSLRYHIPEYMIGYPLYIQDDALKYVYKKLIFGGFMISIPSPCTLDIEW